jgi:hypothetical protein
MESAKMPYNWRMNKENVTNVNEKNKIMLFAAERMKLEIVTLSEISQAQKDKYHIFIHIQNLDLK